MQHIDLSKNQINDFTGEKIAQFVKKNDILTHLNLSDNLLKDETGQKFELILDVNHTLQYLNLALNSIRPQFMEKISLKVQRNRQGRKGKCIAESKHSIEHLK